MKFGYNELKKSVSKIERPIIRIAGLVAVFFLIKAIHDGVYDGTRGNMFVMDFVFIFIWAYSEFDWYRKDRGNNAQK